MPFPALRPDTLRSAVVVGDDGELAVAVRDAVPRAMVLVLDARPDEAAAAVAVCRPYPWALVWATAGPLPDAAGVARQPTLLLAGPAAAGAPPGSLRWSTARELVALLRGMLDATVAGMRLAPGMGVQLPGGDVVRSASLQALVSAHPRGVVSARAPFRGVTSLLQEHGVGCTMSRSAQGLVSLVAAGPTP